MSAAARALQRLLPWHRLTHAATSPTTTATTPRLHSQSLCPRLPPPARYMSGGVPVQQTVVGVTSALRGIGLTTAVLRNAAGNIAAASRNSGYTGGLTPAAGRL